MNDINNPEDIYRECFDHLENAFATDNYSTMENRLQELLMTIPIYSSRGLSAYLSATKSYRDHLPSWEPLLYQSIEFARIHGERVDIIFSGLQITYRDIINKNTGNLPNKE